MYDPKLYRQRKLFLDRKYKQLRLNFPDDFRDREVA